MQPKLHATLSHLVKQVQLHQGLADKNDDMIEKAHQPWKRQKERTWNIRNFKTQQGNQLSSMRKRSHFEVSAIVASVANKRRKRYKNKAHNPVTRAAAGAQALRLIKQEKREAFEALDPIAIDSSSDEEGHGEPDSAQ